MAFLTYDELRKWGSGITEGEIRKFARFSEEVRTVFLSHSAADSDFLPGVVKFFGFFGASVYVDEGDSSLPTVPSPVTGQLLRAKIHASPRFVLMASPNSRGSRWIPWELGLADGTKGALPVAILPIGPASAEESWVEVEYLGLYPRIVQRTPRGRESPRWYVRDPRDHTLWTLEQWLCGPLE